MRILTHRWWEYKIVQPPFLKKGFWLVMMLQACLCSDSLVHPYPRETGTPIERLVPRVPRHADAGSDGMFLQCTCTHIAVRGRRQLTRTPAWTSGVNGASHGGGHGAWFHLQEVPEQAKATSKRRAQSRRCLCGSWGQELCGRAVTPLPGVAVRFSIHLGVRVTRVDTSVKTKNIHLTLVRIKLHTNIKCSDFKVKCSRGSLFWNIKYSVDQWT